MNTQIITSLLDVDLYKLTMLQWIMHYFPNEHVVFDFTNRTSRIRLGDELDLVQLREEIDAVKALSFTDEEISYLASLSFFREDFLAELRKLKLADVFVERTQNGDLIVRTEGPWESTTLWETIILAIVNELYFRRKLKVLHQTQVSSLYQQGRMKLLEKTRVLKMIPEIIFSEFGTRRRFSKSWQKTVTETLVNEIPGSLLGTSNVALSKELGIKPIGTLAHELFMGLYGIRHGSDKEMRSSHNEVLTLWREFYGDSLSVALTDTYGTNFFFGDMSKEQALQWKGLRQDSGDPIVFGEQAIRFYEKHGIDPKEKILVFSDGLDVETIVKLYLYFRGRINISFGWGTNLTNDLGFLPLSIVMKLVSAQGNGTVKLPDNIAKAIGTKEDIARAKHIFDYKETFFVQPVY